MEASSPRARGIACGRGGRDRDAELYATALDPVRRESAAVPAFITRSTGSMSPPVRARLSRHTARLCQRPRSTPQPNSYRTLMQPSCGPCSRLRSSGTHRRPPSRMGSIVPAGSWSATPGVYRLRPARERLKPNRPSGRTSPRWVRSPAEPLPARRSPVDHRARAVGPARLFRCDAAAKRYCRATPKSGSRRHSRGSSKACGLRGGLRQPRSRLLE